MKTPKVLTDVEEEAARQLNLMVRAVKKQYRRLVTPATRKRAQTAERRYIRTAEETIASAEKIIAKLKPRIATAKRSLGVTTGKVKRRVKAKRKVKTKARATATKAQSSAKKNSLRARKKKQ